MYREIINPILNHLPAEEMHVLVRQMLHYSESTPQTLKLLEFLFAYGRKRFSDPRLNVDLAGIKLDNPVMVGAGWDKKGVAVKALHQLGAAGVEVGSVLLYPQPGNPKPRQFTTPGGGVALNRLGFNSPGVEEVRKNLKRYADSNIPLGISIGKNKDIALENAPQVHALVADRLYDQASYFAINVSSPNTPGLRQLQDKGPLTDIVAAVNEVMELHWERRKPVFVKIAPELTFGAVDDVIQVAVDNGLAGIITSNTTIDEKLKEKYGWGGQMGGLSGNDPIFRRMSTRQIAHIRQEAPKTLAIIGVGGIHDGYTALEKIKAGANAVQIVTALRGEGLSVFGKINQYLFSEMELDGIKNINEWIGQETSIYLVKN